MYCSTALSFLPTSVTVQLDSTYQRILRNVLGVDNRFPSHLVYALLDCKPLVNHLAYTTLRNMNSYSFSANTFLNTVTNFCSRPSILRFASVWLKTPSSASVTCFKYSKNLWKTLCAYNCSDLRVPLLRNTLDALRNRHFVSREARNYFSDYVVRAHTY